MRKTQARTFLVSGVTLGMWCEENEAITEEIVEGVNHVGDAVMRALNWPNVYSANVTEYERDEKPEPHPFIDLVAKEAAEEAEYERREAERQRELAEQERTYQGWFE